MARKRTTAVPKFDPETAHAESMAMLKAIAADVKRLLVPHDTRGNPPAPVLPGMGERAPSPDDAEEGEPRGFAPGQGGVQR